MAGLILFPLPFYVRLGLTALYLCMRDRVKSDHKWLIFLRLASGIFDFSLERKTKHSTSETVLIIRANWWIINDYRLEFACEMFRGLSARWLRQCRIEGHYNDYRERLQLHTAELDRKQTKKSRELTDVVTGHGSYLWHGFQRRGSTRHYTQQLRRFFLQSTRRILQKNYSVRSFYA